MKKGLQSESFFRCQKYSYIQYLHIVSNFIYYVPFHNPQNINITSINQLSNTIETTSFKSTKRKPSKT